MGIQRRKKHTAKITQFKGGTSPERDRNCI